MMAAFLCAFSGMEIAHAESRLAERHKIEWTEARGRVQHLESLLLAPTQLTESVNEKTGTRDRSLECLFERNPSETWLNLCSDHLFEISRQGASSFKKMQIGMIVERALGLKDVGDWTQWLKISTTMVLLNEFELARSAFKAAAQRAARQYPTQTWIEQRLGMFLLALDLLEKKDPIERRGIVQSVATSSDFDSGTVEILRRIKNISETSDNKSFTQTSPDKHQQRLKELNYRHWQVSLDMDEILALQDRISTNKLDADHFERLGLLARSYGFEDSEWKAISNTLSRVSAGADLLSRSRGLQLLLEHWIDVVARREDSTKLDSDNALFKMAGVTQEFARVLQRLVEKSIPESLSESELELWKSLGQRLAGINSPMTITFNKSLFERDLLAAKSLQQRLREINSRIHRANALLAASYFSHEQNPAIAQDIKSVRGDLFELERMRGQLVLEYFSMHSLLEPKSQGQYRAMLRTTAQLRKTIQDIQKILPANRKKNDPSIEAERFIQQANAFLSKVESEAQAVITARKSLTKSVLAQISPVQQEVEKVGREFSAFMEESSRELKPKIMAISTRLRSGIERKLRQIEYDITVENSHLKDEMDLRRERLSNTKERLEDLRRIRSENLEWRISQ